MLQKPGAYSGQIWQRFKKNKLALAALIVIAVATFCAIFAYWIVPDNSPMPIFKRLKYKQRNQATGKLFYKSPMETAQLTTPFIYCSLAKNNPTS